MGNFRGIHATPGKKSGLYPSMYRSKYGWCWKKDKGKNNINDEKVRLDTFKDQFEKFQEKKMEENANVEAEVRRRESAEVHKREKHAFKAEWMSAMGYVKDNKRIPSPIVSSVELEAAWWDFCCRAVKNHAHSPAVAGRSRTMCDSAVAGSQTMSGGGRRLVM